MQTLQAVSVLHKSHNDTLYCIENGLHVRDVTIDSGLGEEVCIGHVSDLHFNYCNEQDMAEADPVVMSTLENRMWLANGASVPNARRCLAFLRDMDQVVVNGDTLDYLSHGCMELMQREVWDAYPGIIATMGGHEVLRKMLGKVEDPLSRKERLRMLEDFWPHDPYYISKLVKNRVLVVGLFNDLGCYTAYQEEKLRADLALARENGYAVLLFEHEPIRTMNPAESCVRAEDVLQVGDPNGYPIDYCTGSTGYGKYMAGADACDRQTKAVYSLIVNSADVIRGVFAGHRHSHIYTEIIGRTPDGAERIIPQFINTASAYQKGHVMRILVK